MSRSLGEALPLQVTQMHCIYNFSTIKKLKSVFSWFYGLLSRKTKLLCTTWPLQGIVRFSPESQVLLGVRNNLTFHPQILGFSKVGQYCSLSNKWQTQSCPLVGIACVSIAWNDQFIESKCTVLIIASSEAQGHWSPDLAVKLWCWGSRRVLPCLPVPAIHRPPALRLEKTLWGIPICGQRWVIDTIQLGQINIYI